MVAGSKAELEGQDRWTASNDMFWTFAKWLFEIKGDFTDDVLKAKLPTMGITDVDQFMKIMNGPGTLKIVQNDALWGEALGLYYTPMMFVNGVEVRGWLTRPSVLTEMIDAAAAANPPAADARSDQPPLAATKFFDDWRLSPVMPIPAPAADHVKVSPLPGEKVSVVVFGDFNETNCKKIDTMIKGWMASKPISYSWRHFPFDNTCNPAVPKTMFESGCAAAKGVEAAALVGGAEGYWNMHDMLFQKAENLRPNLIAMAAGVIGLDQGKYDAAAAGNEVAQLVKADTMLGQQMRFRAIPAIYVNGKLVERWSRNDTDNVLERVIDYAAKHPEENKPAGK
jgi:protein-disulfide isomerase